MTQIKREEFAETEDYFKYAEAIVSASGNQDAVMRRIGEILKDVDIRISEASCLLV